jgi:hypothetical protein
LPLYIQKEVFDEGKAIPDTAAGEELTRELNAQMERHREQMQVPREGLEQALKEKDEEPRRELGVEIQRLKMKVEWLPDDSKRMASHYKLQINQIKDTLWALKLKLEDTVKLEFSTVSVTGFSEDHSVLSRWRRLVGLIFIPFLRRLASYVVLV